MPSPFSSVRLRYRIVTQPALDPPTRDARYPWLQSHSLTGNFLRRLSGLFNDANADPMDVLNITRLIDPTQNAFAVEAADGNDDFGLLIGDGNPVSSVTINQLTSKIVEGLAPGQVQYGVTVSQPIVETSTGFHFVIERSLLNSAAADITVTEMALYSTFAPWFFCIIYDGLSEPVVLPGSSSALLQYFFETITQPEPP